MLGPSHLCEGNLQKTLCQPDSRRSHLLNGEGRQEGLGTSGPTEQVLPCERKKNTFLTKWAVALIAVPYCSAPSMS